MKVNDHFHYIVTLSLSLSLSLVNIYCLVIKLGKLLLRSLDSYEKIMQTYIFSRPIKFFFQSKVIFNYEFIVYP